MGLLNNVKYLHDEHFPAHTGYLLTRPLDLTSVAPNILSGKPRNHSAKRPTSHLFEAGFRLYCCRGEGRSKTLRSPKQIMHAF